MGRDRLFALIAALACAAACNDSSRVEAVPPTAPSVGPGSGSVASGSVASGAAPSSTASAGSSASTTPVTPKVSLPWSSDLPQITACARCPWPGTGCVGDSCGLDPRAVWRVHLASETPSCVCGMGFESPCCEADDDAAKQAAIRKQPSLVSSEDLVGLGKLTLLSFDPNAFPPDGTLLAPELTVNAKLFEAPGVSFELLNDLGQVKQISAYLELQKDQQARTIWPALSTEGASKSAEKLIRQARAIDAESLSFKRKQLDVAAESGFVSQVTAFFRGDKLVKVTREAPYTPPLLITLHYYDEKGERFFVRSLRLGDIERCGAFPVPAECYGATAYAGAKPIWEDTAPSCAKCKADPTALEYSRDLRDVVLGKRKRTRTF
ncbi:MAG: hypothetical protein AB7K71_11995 [Polyangiaceae bacterium]